MQKEVLQGLSLIIATWGICSGDRVEVITGQAGAALDSMKTGSP